MGCIGIFDRCEHFETIWIGGVEMSLVEGYLEFVQQSFNTGSTNYTDIITNLENISQALQAQTSSKEIDRIEQIKKLVSEQGDVRILEDNNLFSRVENITSRLDLSQSSARSVYRLSEDLIHDIKSARNWLSEYEKVAKQLTMYSMSKLITLGQAILGKAVEDCPYKTGTLRASGVLIVYKDYIIIAFAAPYATYVHELVGNRHETGRAKFLELAVQEFLPNRASWIETNDNKTLLVKIGINSQVNLTHNIAGKW